MLCCFMKNKTNRNNKRIEIEFRAMFDKKKYSDLYNFLNKNAEDLGEDNKDVYFFILKDKLLKVVNNVSKKNAKIVLKLNRIGKGSDFEEIEIPIKQKETKKAINFFNELNITDNIIHSFQKRHNYVYKGVEIALKFSSEWQYHLELEIMISDKSQKESAERKIKKIAKELEVELMSDDELAKFVKKVENKNGKKKKI